MSNNNEISVAQKRAMRRAEFMRKFGSYWFIYLALFGTAALSFVSGLMLPFQPDITGYIAITFGGVLAAAYYAVGFLTTGEGAAYFWFDKLTDQDPDNTTQKIVAVLMLVVAIATSLTTALAAGAFIAYWMGMFTEFYVMPAWAQKWVVWAIPTMWVLHFIAGTIFRAVSEEAEYEREAKSIIRTAQNQMAQSKSQAKADYWTENAPTLARQLGEMEAQDELDNYRAKLDERKAKRDKHNQPPQSRPIMAQDTTRPELKAQDNGSREPDPTPGANRNNNSRQ